MPTILQHIRGGLTIPVLSALAVTGCQRPSVAVPERSEQCRQELRALDDSVLAQSPKATAMARRGMAGATDSLTWYDFYIRMAKLKMLSQRPEDLLPYTRRTRAFVERMPQTPRTNGLKAFAYELEADYYYRYYTKLDTSIRLRTVAYGAMMESNAKEFLPEMCANMADTYTQMNNLPMAASWYRRALFLVDSLQLPESKNATLYIGLARVYFNMEDYRTALHYFKLCERSYDTMAPNMKIYYVCCRGNYHYYNKEYAQALRCFDRMRALLEKAGDNGIDMAICQINLADTYMNLGRLTEAERAVDRAERFFTRHGMDVCVYYAHAIRTGLAARGRVTRDIPRMIATEKPDCLMDKNIVSIRNRYLKEYYEASGDYRSALATMEREVAMHDSIERDRQYMRAMEIMQRLREDTLRLHHEMIVQHKDDQLRLTRAVTAAGIALVAILLMFYWTRQHRRRLQDEVTMMRLRIDNARNRVSPHFIFNVLNNHLPNLDSRQQGELARMAQLIRYSLDMSHSRFVTLDDELRFVESYITVEQPLLGEGFTFRVDAPPAGELRRIVVPSMFVQILVENAIKHGLREREGERRLTVTVTRDGAWTDIAVTDNGTGFDIRKVQGTRSRNGLSIIRHTIQIFNERSKNGRIRFTISNMTDDSGHISGCRAAIRLPEIKLEEEEKMDIC